MGCWLFLGCSISPSVSGLSVWYALKCAFCQLMIGGRCVCEWVSLIKILNQVNTSLKRSVLLVEPDCTSIWLNNGKRGDCHYHVHAWLLYRIYGSCNHIKNNILHIVLFAFFTTFIKDCLAFCSLICMFIPLADFVMRRVLLRVYLDVLICVLIANLVAFLLLHWQFICQSQTWIKILKCALNSTLIILLALDIAEEINNDK